MKNAKTTNKNKKAITAFPRYNEAYAAIRAVLREPDCSFHYTTEAHLNELDTFLSFIKLTECRRTLIYVQAFFTMYRRDGAHLGLNDSIIEGWEELQLLNDFLGDIDQLEKDREELK